MNRKGASFLLAVFMIVLLSAAGCQSRTTESTESQINESGKTESTGSQVIESEEAGIRIELIDEGDGASISELKGEKVSAWYVWDTDPGSTPVKKTIIFDGVEYHGTFDHTFGAEGYAGAFDAYRIDDVNDGFDFTLDHETGVLVGISLYHTLNHETKDSALPVPENPSKYAETQARKWASELLGDAEDYEMVFLGHFNDYWYSYRFIRKEYGMDSTDYLTIEISERGALANFSMRCAGWTKQYKEELSKLKAVQIEQAVSAELQKSEATLLSVQNSFFGLTPEKKAVLIVNCEVRTREGMVTAAKYMISVE